MFTGSNGDRPSAPNYLILLTDGLYGNSTSNWVEAVSARANQINIITVRLSNNLLRICGITDLLQSIAERK